MPDCMTALPPSSEQRSSFTSFFSPREIATSSSKVMSLNGHQLHRKSRCFQTFYKGLTEFESFEATVPRPILPGNL